MSAVRPLLHNGGMAKKLLVARLGAGSITIALCAALPGCNLAAQPTPTDCVGHPSSRGESFVVCSGSDSGTDQARADAFDVASDDGPAGTSHDQGAGDGP